MKSPYLFLCLLAPSLGCLEEDALPEIVASSEYIDLRIPNAPATLCVDDKLAEMDRFVESTAALLGEPPPTGRIDLVLLPPELRMPAWPCDELRNACYRYDGEADRGIIYAGAAFAGGDLSRVQWHELVHAVDIPAFGGGHPLLKEGIAEYLSDGLVPDDLLADFAEAFRASLQQWGVASYPVAMQFVGSVIERHGMEKFKLLRVSVKRDADYEEFAAAYQQVYGEALEVALAEMSASALHVDTGRWACRGEAVPWQGSERHLHAELAGTCGDGHFYGGLRGDEQGAAFYKSFVVDVPRDGYYEMFVDGPLYGLLMSCGNTKLGLLGSTQGPAMGTLHAGLHELLVGFPANGSTELALDLVYIAPPPSAGAASQAPWGRGTRR